MTQNLSVIGRQESVQDNAPTPDGSAGRAFATGVVSVIVCVRRVGAFDAESSQDESAVFGLQPGSRDCVSKCGQLSATVTFSVCLWELPAPERCSAELSAPPVIQSGLLTAVCSSLPPRYPTWTCQPDPTTAAASAAGWYPLSSLDTDAASSRSYAPVMNPMDV